MAPRKSTATTITQEPPAYSYVEFDYWDGKLGVRFEPKDERIAKFLTEAIPAEDRLYLAGKRKWVVDPKHGVHVWAAVQQFCADHTKIIETKHKDLILSLLAGPPRKERTVMRAEVFQQSMLDLDPVYWRYENS